MLTHTICFVRACVRLNTTIHQHFTFHSLSFAVLRIILDAKVIMNKSEDKITTLLLQSSPHKTCTNSFAVHRLSQLEVD